MAGENGKKKGAEKKEFVEIPERNELLDALFGVNRECKIAEAEREFLKGELEAYFEPEDDDEKTSATYPGDGTPESVLYVTKRTFTGRFLPSSPTQEMIAFLETRGAADLVKTQAPFASLVVRRPRADGAALAEAGRERAVAVLKQGPEASARRYHALGKTISEMESEMEILKEEISSSPDFAWLAEKSCRYVTGETLSATKNSGGRRTVSSEDVVARLGEETLNEMIEMFGETREKSLFRVTTAAEAAYSRERYVRVREKEALAAGAAAMGGARLSSEDAEAEISL